MTLTSLDHFNQALRFTKHLSQNFLDLAKALRKLKEEEPGLFARVLAEGRIEPRKGYYLVAITAACANSGSTGGGWPRSAGRRSRSSPST